MVIRRRRIWTSVTAVAATLPVATALPPDAGYQDVWGFGTAFAQEGGEGGEGGEAGATVSTDDPAALAIALDSLAAYAQAGLAAYAAGQKEPAAELLAETEEAFEKDVAAALTDPLKHETEEALEKAADLAKNGADPADVAAAGARALHEIAEAQAAVAGDGKVQAKAFLESLNRAALELNSAAKDPADTAAYFEAHGYLMTAKAREAAALAGLDAISADAGAKARAALSALDKAASAPSAPDAPVVPPGDVLAAVSAAMLAAGTL